MSMSAPTREVNVSDRFDVVVIGGGPAGLSAAKCLARMRRSVLVVDAGAGRNAPATGVHNYLYAEGASPARLAEVGRAEAAAYGAQVLTGTATSAIVLDQPASGGPHFTIEVAVGEGGIGRVSARRVLLATGLVDVLPDVQGVHERWGRDVLHCPFCHGWEMRDRAVGVLGTGAMALHQVMLFRSLSSDVVYFQHTAPDPSDQQREQLSAMGVEHVVGKVAGIETTNDVLSGLRMADGRVLAREVIAVSTRLEAREDLLADLGLSTTTLDLGGTSAGHYLAADLSGATCSPGVWAAGNVAAPMAQVINSAAAGTNAGAAIHLDLITEDTEVAIAAHRAQRDASVHDDADIASKTAPDSAESFWEAHYAGSEPGHRGPNPVLVDVVKERVGTALDLGCGGGGDTLWLAQQGWEVLGVDVSPTAVRRTADRASDAHLTQRVRTKQYDLAETFPEGEFDLVNAHYFLSPIAFDRGAVLARAAASIRPGGTLLIVDHASVPPWSWADPDTVFPTPRESLDLIDLDLDQWEIHQLENRDRVATGPEDQHATVTDTIITLVRQHPGTP